MSEAERKPRRRGVPTWTIHSAAGVRIPGGEGPTWWNDARPVADPAPALRPIFGADCSEGAR